MSAADFPYFNNDIAAEADNLKKRIITLSTYKLTITPARYLINNMKNVLGPLDLIFCPRLLSSDEKVVEGLKEIFSPAAVASPYIIVCEDGDFARLNAVSNYFQDRVIASTRRRDGDSVLEVWAKHSDKIKEYAKEENISSLREAVYQYIINKLSSAEVGTFRPALAAGFVNTFYAGLLFKECRVLDICSGWGDRLVGFMAAGAAVYCGVDPNKALIDGYKEMAAFITKTLPQCKTVLHMISAPFQEAKVPDEGYNLIFTSPPYFDLEIYDSSSESQSLKAAEIKNAKSGESTFEIWFEDFLMTSLTKAWKMLVPGGLMCININNYIDFKAANKVFGPDYTGRMVAAVNKRLGAGSGGDAVYCGPLSYAEFIKLPAAKRGGSSNKGNGEKLVPRSPQPFWIWRKSEDAAASKELVEKAAGNKTTVEAIAGTICNKEVVITYDFKDIDGLIGRADFDSIRGMGTKFQLKQRY